MFFILLVIGGVSPILSASVSIGRTDYCSHDDFTCLDGGCVRFDKICDGIIDCLDGSDETICSGVSYDNSWMNNRVKRQSACLKNQWQCRDGTCIGFDGKCDGIVDCPDGSDETHPLCRKIQCQSNWFRCTYGACVDGTAPCNGIQECADNSDELLPRCRNETEEVRGQYKCQNGQTIPASQHCDGAVDCADGSDETVRACAARTCPAYVFQCAYGACVDQGSDCDGKQDCADNSDESDELCNRISPVTKKPAVVTQRPIPQGGKCVLPPYPKHGTYTVGGNPNALPGQTYPNVFINVTCNPGFGVENQRDSLYCYEGVWSEDMPKCVRFCRLYKHPSVEYRCLITGTNGIEGSRECGSLEPAGTVVRPECRTPNYYSGTLSFMHCIDGNWDYVAVCKPGGNITIKVNDSVLIYVTNYDQNTSIEINAGNQNVSVEGNGLNVNIINVGNNNTNLSILSNTTSNGNVLPFDPNGNTINVDGGNSNALTTEDSSLYDIDEGDWRIGQAVVTRPQYLKYKTDNNVKRNTDSPVIYFEN